MEERDKDIIKHNQTEDEIDLIEIAAKLWANRSFIIKITLIFMAIGLFIAIFTPNEYTASTTMVPQTGDKRAGGNLSGLAAMAGISLGSLNSGETLSPNVYPQILNNVNFQKELLYSRFRIEKSEEPVTFLDYKTDKRYRSFNLLQFIKKYTIGIPGLILGSVKENPEKEVVREGQLDDIQKLTLNETRVIKSLFSSLLLNINEKQGFITLSFTCSESKLSAEVVQTAQTLLQKYITEFKLQKVQSNLEFIENSYAEAKRNFEEKQAELANFRDRNISLSSAIAKTQEEKLTSEYNLLLNIYTELAKQREQAKIAVTETTPILTIIKPAIIPSEKSGPNRLIISIGFILFGFIAGSIWSFGYPLLKKYFEKINN